MARSKKPKTLEEQLEILNLEIEGTKENLKKLKKTKKNLEDKIKINQLQELDKIITASGKNIEDVKALLCEKMEG